MCAGTVFVSSCAAVDMALLLLLLLLLLMLLLDVGELSP
jgi:hypothetical protein